MIRIAVFVAILGLALAEKVTFKDCGSVDGKIKTVDISGCTALPCPLKRGSDVSVVVEFDSATDTTSATSVVHGIILGIPAPFPLDNPDGCKDSGLACPLKTGSSYSYTQKLSVKSMYPKLKVVVKWELTDANSKDIFCFMVPVEIVD